MNTTKKSYRETLIAQIAELEAEVVYFSTRLNQPGEVAKRMPKIYRKQAALKSLDALRDQLTA